MRTNIIGEETVIRTIKDKIENKVTEFKSYKNYFSDKSINFSIKPDDDD